MIRDKQLSPRLILLGGVLGLIPVLKWVVSSRQSREAAIDRDERLERHHAASDGWIESTTGWDPSGNDLAASTPAVEDAGSRSPPARLSDSLMVERVDASRSVDAQLATLMEENDRLHEQVERLAAELAAAQERERAGDARLARIGEHLAANELRLESEWRALIEASLDGEKVAADPTRLFAPMLALLKASGVASAAKEEGGVSEGRSSRADGSVLQGGTPVRSVGRDAQRRRLGADARVRGVRGRCADVPGGCGRGVAR